MKLKRQHIHVTLFLLFLIAAGYSFVQVRTAGERNDRYIQNHLEQKSSQELLALRAELDSLYTWNQQLRDMVNLPPLEPAMWQMGLGGVIQPQTDSTMNSFFQIRQDIRLLDNSLQEIQAGAVSLVDGWERIPAIRPVTGGYISSRFGYRKDPFTGHRAFHRGIDYRVPYGTEVHATAAGKVIFAGRMRGFGRLIKIRHKKDLVTVFAHLSKIRVRKGQNVKRGDVIGEVGNSGRSTGAHLHYEVQEKGSAVNPLNYILSDYTMSR